MTSILATASTAPELIGTAAADIQESVFATAGTVLPYAALLIALVVGIRFMKKLTKA